MRRMLQDLTEMLLILLWIRQLSSLYLPALCITVLRVQEQPAAPARTDKRSATRVAQTSNVDSFSVRLSNVALVNRARWERKAVNSIFQTEKQPFFNWMRVPMMSRDASKPKICEKFAPILKMRHLLGFTINSAITESQNPGVTE